MSRFHLDARSINAVDKCIASPTFDLDGVLRPDGDGIFVGLTPYDRGAFEFAP